MIATQSTTLAETLTIQYGMNLFILLRKRFVRQNLYLKYFR